MCDEGEALEFIRSKNLLRRHDTPEEQRARREEFIKAHANWSSRRIADEMEVSKTTVEKHRKQIESKSTGNGLRVDPAIATGQGLPVETMRTGKDGKARKQPAAKPKLTQEGAKHRPRGANSGDPIAACLAEVVPIMRAAIVKMDVEKRSVFFDELRKAVRAIMTEVTGHDVETDHWAETTH
jgi:hypothetical protein